MDSSSNESMQHSVDMLHTLQHFLEKSPTSASRMHRAMEAGHGVPREDVGCSKHLVHSDSKPNGAALCLPPPPLSHTRGKICSCDTTSSASSTYCPSQGSSCCDSASPSFVRSDARAQQDSFRRRKLGASADNALLIAVEQSYTNAAHECETARAPRKDKARTAHEFIAHYETARAAMKDKARTAQRIQQAVRVRAH
eukprot:CAMPEP_0119338740 /NCGR_PEP_ID=MMETSP1333-20130426/96788_1 /TAXON_ID=418940 /ORGANISM="Scyphosphaera apsteinii, Strain RCC1455" /LENGTH=196 /DNA_ID=CAMNT_0007350103 /DNA_START=94 /DNA_END=685 /DNA_ORIENTATION=+